MSLGSGRRNLSWSGLIKGERACKPNSVLDNHSSGTSITECLSQHTRKLRAGSPLFPKKNAPLFCLSPSGVYRAADCRQSARWSLTPPFHPYRPFLAEGLRRYVFCGTFRCLTAPGSCPALCPGEFGLSSSLRYLSGNQRLPGSLAFN